MGPTWRRPSIAAACLAALLLGAGCGKDAANRGAIRGEVKLDGQPLAQGSILFKPMEGTKGVPTGGPIEKGRYQLAGADGPAIGWNRVEIRSMRKSGEMVQKPLGKPGELVEKSVEAIPPRFNSASTLKTEVKPGDNQADFQVESR